MNAALLEIWLESHGKKIYRKDAKCAKKKYLRNLFVCCKLCFASFAVKSFLRFSNGFLGKLQLFKQPRQAICHV